jgi:uncharacterized alpha-E superfamily protein
MLSRVADSLYWMSRYFERADYCARVLEANYNLMLNPSKASTEQRWHRITASLGLGLSAVDSDPQSAMVRLTTDASNKSSILSCIATARENASQVREQISSEMWERLNQLYHDINEGFYEQHFQTTSVVICFVTPSKVYEPSRIMAMKRSGSAWTVMLAVHSFTS